MLEVTEWKNYLHSFKKLADKKKSFFQSNHEGAIIDEIHRVRNIVDGIIINAGAYTHYSFAIRDAIEILKIPVIEIHLSDIDSREEFRKKSVIAGVCFYDSSNKGCSACKCSCQCSQRSICHCLDHWRAR